ncbi:MAG: rhodanese-like domain-containing protein [Thermomicrobiales bacterium]|nr:rhodanese-like domain-containing protein [Thermomicrobiales bacterium]
MTSGTNGDAAALDPLEVDIAQVESALTDAETQIIDCREPDEWAQAHLDGTTLIPLGSLAFRVNELDPARPVIVVCRSGARSLAAAEMLVSAGFQDAKSLAGGLIAWAGSGRPLVR